MNTLKKIGHGYNKFEEYLLVISLAVTVTLIFYQVIMRFIFNDAPSWTEEVTRYIFIWQIWLGASLGLKDKQHIRIELISGALIKRNKLKSKNLLEIVILLIWLALNVVLVIAGTDVCQQLVAKDAVSAGQRIPLVFVNAALPLCAFVVSIRLIVQIIEEGRKLVKGGAA